MTSDRDQLAELIHDAVYSGAQRVTWEMRTITKIVKYTDACPTQWDAWDSDGKRYYIRYRFGRLTAIEVPDRDDWYSTQGVFPKVLELSYGTGLDGAIDFDELKLTASHVFEFQDDLVEDHREPEMYILHFGGRSV